MNSAPKIGDTLEHYRNNAGLTQEELAESAGVHRTYVSLLERNKKSPTLKVVFQLCRALDVRPSELLATYEKNGHEQKWW